jgi:hypothetical protein
MKGGRMAGKKPQPESDEIAENIGEVDDGDLSTLDVTVDAKVKEWLELHNLERLKTTVRLYRFQHPETGEDKSIAGQWEGDFPDAHSIGLMYGSGRYLLLISTPQGKNQKRLIRGYRFRIHPYYDELRRSGQGVNAQAWPMAQAVPVPAIRERPAAVPDPVAALMPIVEVLRLVLPLVKGNGDNLQIGRVMTANFEAVNELMKRQAMQTQDYVFDMLQRQAELPTTEEKERPPGLLETLLPYIERFVPMLLGGGPKAEAVAGLVRALPEFERLVSQQTEVAKIISYLDKALPGGVADTDRILSSLQIQRPAGGGGQ